MTSEIMAELVDTFFKFPRIDRRPAITLEQRCQQRRVPLRNFAFSLAFRYIAIALKVLRQPVAMRNELKRRAHVARISYCKSPIETGDLPKFFNPFVPGVRRLQR